MLTESLYQPLVEHKVCRLLRGSGIQLRIEKKGHCSVSSHLGNMGIEKDNTVMVCLVCLAPSGIY